MIYTRPDGFQGSPHSPGAALDYYFDWRRWLAGSKIALSTWNITAPLTVSNPQLVGEHETSCLVSGVSVLGAEYTLYNTITTTDVPPRIETRILILECRYQ